MARYQDVVERYRQLDPGHVNDVFDAIAAALRLTDEEHSHPG